MSATMLDQAPTLVFYDGACPICAKEMRVLRRHDRAGRLMMIDIAAANFDERAWPVCRAAMSAALHVRLPDGTWRNGMAAIRHVYQAIGKGWIVAPTGWPLLSRVCDRAYAWFARNRLRVSARLGLSPCAGGTCRIPR